MAEVDIIKGFDIERAVVTLWTFRGPRRSKSGDLRYTGRWTEKTDGVDAALKVVFSEQANGISEVKDYGLLEENNEGSALLIGLDETHGGLVLKECAAETAKRKASKMEDIRNSNFYVVKLAASGRVIYGVRKTDQSWRTKRALSVRSMVYRDGELDVDDRPRFDISRTLDFFVVDSNVYCLDKRNFESVLQYKQAHQDDFVKLQNESGFKEVFSEMRPFIEFVGENKILLRRASAIREKKNYMNPGFMKNLRELHKECGLTLNFDGDGKLVATPETCADIMTSLLDHRLASRFSERFFDVRSSTAV